MQKQKWKGNFFLLITAIVWGFAFVAQHAVSGTGLGTLYFCAFRYGLSGLLMLPVIHFTQKQQGRSGVNPFDFHTYCGRNAVTDDVLRARRAETLKAGFISGFFLCAGSLCQQYAMNITSVGKASFLSALYVIGVPIASLLVFRSRTGIFSWIGASFALIGLYLISFAGLEEKGFSHIATGDLLLIIGAVFWSGQITTIGYYMSRGADGIRLAQMEYSMTGIITLVLALFFESLTPGALRNCLIPILYTSVFSTVIGFTLQIIGQRYTDSTSAALIMSLESVFGYLAGVLFYNDHLQGAELLGSLILFGGVLISQIPSKAKSAAP